MNCTIENGKVRGGFPESVFSLLSGREKTPLFADIKHWIMFSFLTLHTNTQALAQLHSTHVRSTPTLFAFHTIHPFASFVFHVGLISRPSTSLCGLRWIYFFYFYFFITFFPIYVSRLPWLFFFTLKRISVQRWKKNCDDPGKLFTRLIFFSLSFFFFYSV